MNSISLTNEIRIERTNDDTLVIGLRIVQSDKVFAVECQYCAQGWISAQ